VSLAEFFFLRTHNNLQHQSAHEGENYAHEHFSHDVLYGQNDDHESWLGYIVVEHDSAV
jgi:hypothetical protein